MKATSPRLQTVAVLGAGTMGARIAAHLANQGIRVHLLDLAGPADDRSRAARVGLEAALRARPAAFFLPDLARNIQIGNFEDHAERLRTADWIIEAVVEDLGAKQSLLTRLAPFVAPHAALTTNTSGLPIAAIGEALPAELRRRWFGTHFFNPPRYMRLLEVIPSPWSEPEIIDAIAGFANRRLGKGIVFCRDTPNFIANRIGTFSLLNVLRHMQALGLTVDEVDALTGPVLGWPQSATFRTLDLVGLDTLAHVVRNSWQNLPQDEERALFQLPPILETMLQRGWLGEKSGQGFYRKARNGESSAIESLDLTNLEYTPRRKAAFPSLDLAKGIDALPERLRTVVFARDRAGEFLWRSLSDLFLYSARRIPEIADSPAAMDQAMRWGYNWQLGPFELWDALGLEEVVIRMHKEGRAVPEFVTRLLASGAKSFYRWSAATLPPPAHGRSARPATTLPEHEVFTADYEFQSLPVSDGTLRLEPLRRGGHEVRKNAGCSLFDLGQGVGCIEFHSKMNTLGGDIVQMLTATLQDDTLGIDAYVLGGEAENFSVGANLLQLLLTIQNDDWDEVDLAVRAFQGMTMAVKRSPRPVVVAPYGIAFGGGCELMLHAARNVAHAELYAGLVEVGVGLIPAGGGSKEMLLRAVHSALALQAHRSRGEAVELQDAVRHAFETIAFGKTSTSAAEARQLGYLQTTDLIIANRDRLLFEARAEARRLADGGWQPPAPAIIPAPGPGVYATLRLGLWLMHQAQYISDHDQKIALHLARILTGGDRPAGSPLTEEALLDLEREAFLSLCGEAKTQERIQHMLKTGKALRN